ncbi:MAG: methylmalonyl-CoA mutase family protein, partial [Parvibaculaceae bacterium]
LWARILEAMDVEARPAVVHVETAWRMLSRRDPHVNLLRAATAAFSCLVGGADSVTVLPHTAAIGEADGFARRMARNILMLLTEESGVGRVADPAAGSGYVEALTRSLAEKAWADFQEIEREGGLSASLGSGAVQRRIAEAAARRNAAIATRKIPLTGVSEFPNLNEPPLTPSPSPPEGRVAASGVEERSSDRGGQKKGEGDIAPLSQHRLSEPFERLRDAADAFAGRTGARPAVYLATLGSLAEHGARAAWIENLLAAGGIGATRGPATADGFSTSGASIACLCGSDAAYEAGAVAAVRALKEAGASEVLLAGRPREQEAVLKASGLDGLLHAGQDVLAALERLHAALGIAPAGDAS